MYFCVAPRRDWFVKDEGSLKGLKNLPRVFGCNSYECTEYMKNIIGRVCDKLVVAENYIQAEMTKSVENAIRHVGITLANQLADAFPDTDIIKVLQLASSKWNVELYQPSLGIGGYCIPLSSKYLLKASPEKTLSVLQETVTYNKRREQDMIELLLKENASAICVFGICYVGNVKVIKNSMIVDFVRKCIANNLNIKVRDSMYSADEIKNIFQHDDLVAKNDEKFEMLVLFSAHKEYTDFFAEKICGMLYGKKIIWDNTGAWEKYRREFEQKGIQYKRIGSKGWKKI